MQRHSAALVLTLLGLAAAAPAGAVAQTPAPGAAQAQANPYFEFLMARRLESEGDVAGALAALQRAATAEPRAASIRAEIAALEFRRNRRDEAERAAREALALDEANPDAHRILGFIFTARADGVQGRNGQNQALPLIREAITHLDRAAASPSASTDINVFLTLGRLNLRIEDGEKAVQALSRVVALNPNFVQGRQLLAQGLLMTGNLNGAIQVLAEIVEDEPRVASTLGQYLERAGRMSDAAEAYAKALEVAPNNRDIKFRRAAALFAAREFAAAADASGTAQAEHPDDLRFPRLRARALFESGASARAIDVLEPVARANLTDNAIQFALADLFSDAGRVPDAERTVRQVVNREPGNAVALNYLGYLLADKGAPQQLDEAIGLVRRALELEPENPSYLDSLGWAYYRRGDMVQAERYLAPAADKLPMNSVIQDHMGDVLAGLGRWQDAIAAWMRALDGDGDSIEVAAIEKKIQDARTRVR